LEDHWWFSTAEIQKWRRLNHEGTQLMRRTRPRGKPIIAIFSTVSAHSRSMRLIVKWQAYSSLRVAKILSRNSTHVFLVSLSKNSNVCGEVSWIKSILKIKCSKTPVTLLRFIGPCIVIYFYSKTSFTLFHICSKSSSLYCSYMLSPQRSGGSSSRYSYNVIVQVMYVNLSCNPQHILVNFQISAWMKIW